MYAYVLHVLLYIFCMRIFVAWIYVNTNKETWQRDQSLCLYVHIGLIVCIYIDPCKKADVIHIHMNMCGHGLHAQVFLFVCTYRSLCLYWHRSLCLYLHTSLCLYVHMALFICVFGSLLHVHLGHCTICECSRKLYIQTYRYHCPQKFIL